MTKPLPGIMYGLTHDETGAPVIREPKLLKVGIGLPRGRALTVWTTIQDGKTVWKLAVGFKKGEIKTQTFPDRKTCETAWRNSLDGAPVASYPRKISFFTFTRPVTTDQGEEFIPDFDAIEAHGPGPTEIDVVFLDDNPFMGQYQMWSASELKCHGDGINALRVVSMAAAEQKHLIEPGERWFPIVDGCWTKGCPYAGAEKGCKPGGDLKFQLARNIRVGGTAYFHTTGFRSISQIFSSLERIKMLTNGRLRGLPLKMVLRPYRVKPEGQKATTQYGVSLELRSEDMEKLRRLLVENLWTTPVAAAPRQIEAPADEEPIISAQAMTAEFYPESAEQDEDEQDGTARPEAAAATDKKTEDLAEKLKQRRSASQEQPKTQEGGKRGHSQDQKTAANEAEEAGTNVKSGPPPAAAEKAAPPAADAGKQDDLF